jgi:hypothetical protein
VYNCCASEPTPWQWISPEETLEGLKKSAVYVTKWIAGGDKKLGMLVLKIIVPAVNVRHKLRIVKTMKLRRATGMVNRVRLV